MGCCSSSKMKQTVNSPIKSQLSLMRHALSPNSKLQSQITENIQSGGDEEQSELEFDADYHLHLIIGVSRLQKTSLDTA